MRDLSLTTDITLREIFKNREEGMKNKPRRMIIEGVTGIL
jgi:hypothetical protein